MKISKNLLLEILLLLLIFFYYLFFVNKGIVLYDEGVYAHGAERILQGELPYKDFVLYYTPGYYYLLAGLFKIFGHTIFVGRIFNVFICTGIVYLLFQILKKLKVNSWKHKILSALLVVSFGYPLMNISIMVWVNVFLAELLILFFFNWLQEKKSVNINLFVLGFVLALSLFFKQTTGPMFIFLVNFLIAFSKKRELGKRFLDLIILNTSLLLFTAIWTLYIFRNNYHGLFDFLIWASSYVSGFPFSYPPLSFIFQPFGIFKLLPYYVPLVFLFLFIPYLFKKNKDWGLLAFCLVTLGGFAISMYPATDLLHVYPFFGLLSVSILTFFHRKTLYFGVSVLMIILIAIGFYLTFFNGYYRYQPRYQYQNTPLSLSKTNGLMIEKDISEGLIQLNNFRQKNISPNDPVIVYPFSPLLYFLLDLKNGSKDYIFSNLNKQDEYLQEVKKNKIKYIITSGSYINGGKFSKFIQKQKEIGSFGFFKIFEVIAI